MITLIAYALLALMCLSWLLRGQHSLRRLPTVSAESRTVVSPSTEFVLVALVAGCAAVIASAVVSAIVVLGALWWRRRRVGGPDLTPDTELAMVADLLGVGLAGGLTVAQTIDVFGTHLEGPVAGALVDARRRQRLGLRFSDELAAALSSFGSDSAALANLLASHLDEGAAIGPQLEELSAEARDRRRRAGETEARRLPVLMLVPLVTLVLPAFLLLSVIPVVYDAVGGLAWL